MLTDRANKWRFHVTFPQLSSCDLPCTCVKSSAAELSSLKTVHTLQSTHNSHYDSRDSCIMTNVTLSRVRNSGKVQVQLHPRTKHYDRRDSDSRGVSLSLHFLVVLEERCRCTVFGTVTPPVNSTSVLLLLLLLLLLLTNFESMYHSVPIVWNKLRVLYTDNCVCKTSYFLTAILLRWRTKNVSRQFCPG